MQLQIQAKENRCVQAERYAKELSLTKDELEATIEVERQKNFAAQDQLEASKQYTSMLERQLETNQASNQMDQSQRTSQMQAVITKLESQLKQEQQAKVNIVQEKRSLEIELAQVKDRAEKLSLLFAKKYDIDFETY